MKVWSLSGKECSPIISCTGQCLQKSCLPLHSLKHCITAVDLSLDRLPVNLCLSFLLFFFSKELYQLSDNKLKKQKKVGSKARELLLEQQLNQSPSKLYHDTQSSKVEAAKQKINNVRSHYAYNKPLIPPVRPGVVINLCFF